MTSNNGATITGINLRYPTSSRKEEVYLTSDQIAEMIDPETGILTLNIRVPYDDVEYIIEAHIFDENGFSRSTGAYQPASLAKAGYYEISNVGQFFWFAAQVNNGNHSINGRITAPLDMSANHMESWNTMGTAECPDSAIPIGSIAGQMLNSTLAHSYSKAIIENDCSCNVGDVGGLIGRNLIVSCSIENSYFYWNPQTCFAVGEGYIPEDAHEVFAEDLASGEIASLLNGGASEGIWTQNIGTDEYPVFANP